MFVWIFGSWPSPYCFVEITTSLGNPGQDWPSWYQPYHKNRNRGQLFMWFIGQLDGPIYHITVLADHFNLPLLVEQLELNSPQWKISSADWFHINNTEKSCIILFIWEKLEFAFSCPMAAPQKRLLWVLPYIGEQVICICPCHKFPDFCLGS